MYDVPDDPKSMHEGILHCMFLLVGECLFPGHANQKRRAANMPLLCKSGLSFW